MRALNILITGQVRDEQLFRSAVERLVSFRSVDAISRIVFSTWVGEIGRYAGLRPFLRDRGVETVESVLPSQFMDVKGNFFHQVVQFVNGLEQFSPDDLIFKTRPDIRSNLALDFEAMARFAYKYLNQRPVQFGPLRRRIGVGAWHPYIPFWMEDRFFYGYCSDLRMLAKFSRAGDIQANPENFIAETRWFGEIFAEYYPLVRHMMRLSWIYRAQETNADRIAEFYNNDLFYKFLAAYHFVVDHFFLTGLDLKIVDVVAYEGSVENVPTGFEASMTLDSALMTEHPAYRETQRLIDIAGESFLSDPDIVGPFRDAVDLIQRDCGSPLLVSPAYYRNLESDG